MHVLNVTSPRASMKVVMVMIEWTILMYPFISKEKPEQ
jgi:hypothetical protein